MKEIKFRGMCSNGIMRYGRLSQDKPNQTSYYEEYSQRICWDDSNIPVSNKTLGQYIGLKDKNDKEIYEGDLVRCIAEEKYCKDSGVYPIEYDLFEQQFRPNFACHLGWGGWTSIEVIGNVYENPELVTNV